MKLGRKKRLMNEFYRQLKEKFPQVSDTVVELTDSIHSNNCIRINVSDHEDQTLKKLAEEFEYKINHTCSKCGRAGDFADPFCARCYYRIKCKYSVKKINPAGFSVFKNFYRRNKWVTVKWNNLDRVELSEFDTVLRINFFLKPENIFNRKTDWDENSFSVFELEQGFYKLLKNVPDYLFSENNLYKKNEILTLESCGICGYIAKSKNQPCFVCGERYLHDSDLSERMKQKYSSAFEINKSSQIHYCLQTQKKYRYPKREKEFIKDHQHKILFSKDELQQKQEN
ncbi:hypothetical protein [Chryseobacterium shigense]|uniref:Uncharacterized protein n=1 Tax=Chryseobacterium shigense TaxID=297244 RepID=A0A841N6H0_9FLAO|nr:hypothetical protein [Chryseobacterium shigense]MBB6370713.1 hypothetical protein [Chryseobacterium shigense]